MCKFKIDNCKYCSTVTDIGYYKNVNDVMVDIQKGLVRCSECKKHGTNHTEFDVYEQVNGRWTLVWSKKTNQEAA